MKIVEPKYLPIGERMATKAIQALPKDMRDIIQERHIRQRNQIGQIIGEIELSWHRGRHRGRVDAIEALEKIGHTRIAKKLLKKYGISDEAKS